MSTISKRFLNELCDRRIIRESFSINDSNRIDSNDKQYDVFLSYCYVDKSFAIKIVNLFEKMGKLKEGIERWEKLLKSKHKEIEAIKQQNNKREI